MGLNRRQLYSSLTVLSRLAAREQGKKSSLRDVLRANPAMLTIALQVAMQTPEPMAEVLYEAIAESPHLPLDTLLTLHELIPHHSATLIRLGILLGEKISTWIEDANLGADELADVYVTHGFRLRSAGDIVAANTMADKALKILNRPPVTEVTPLLRALRLSAQCNAELGDLAKATRVIMTAVGLAESLSHPNRAVTLWCAAGNIQMQRRDYRAASAAFSLSVNGAEHLIASADTDWELRATTDGGKPAALFIGDPAQAPQPETTLRIGDNVVDVADLHLVVVDSEQPPIETAYIMLGKALTGRAQARFYLDELVEANHDAWRAIEILRGALTAGSELRKDYATAIHLFWLTSTLTRSDDKLSGPQLYALTDLPACWIDLCLEHLGSGNTPAAKAHAVILANYVLKAASDDHRIMPAVVGVLTMTAKQLISEHRTAGAAEVVELAHKCIERIEGR